MSLVRYSACLEVIQNPLHVLAKGITGPKWSLYGLPKKIRHLGIKIDWGEKYYLQCIGANGKAFTLQVYNYLNFSHLLGFLKITCDLMSDRSCSRNSRRIVSTIRGTVYTTAQSRTPRGKIRGFLCIRALCVEKFWGKKGPWTGVLGKKGRELYPDSYPKKKQ